MEYLKFGLGRMLSVVPFLVLLALQSTTAAVDYNSADVVPPLQVDIKSFRVLGENPLKERRTQSILEKYTGSNKNISDIEDAVKQLEEQFRKQGHSFYRATVTSQELHDGEIELTIERYRIGAITVTGNRYYSEKNILASLPQLIAQSSPSTAAMSRSLRIANLNAGKRTQLQLQSSEIHNVLDAAIQVVDQKPLVISAWLNNTGSDLTGDLRIGVSVEHRNLFARDHIANLSFVSSPENFDTVQQTALSYQIPLYKVGGKLNFFAVKSDVDTGTIAEIFEVAGRGDVFGVGYTHVLPTHNNYRHQLGLQVSDKLFENEIFFSGQEIGPDVRSRPLSLSYQSSWQLDELSLGWSLAYTKNLGGGSFNDSQSYALSRQGANSRWETLSASMSFKYKQKKWLYTGDFSYSETGDRLITGEQFSLGGSSSIRGMEERELRGDEGYRLAVQAWAPTMKWNIRPVFFFELGEVSINDPGLDELTSETVSSLGLSLYWNPTPRVNASVSFAHLLDGIDSAQFTDDFSVDGDSKIHFNLAMRY